MTKTILRWSLITLLLISSPLIYTEVQAYLTANAAFTAINVFSAKSKTTLAIIFIIFNLLCAIFVAIITALPSGYLARRQPKIIAILFIFATQAIPIYAFFEQPEIRTFSIIVMVGQLIAVVFSAFIFAQIGSRIARKRQKNTAV